MPRLGDRIKETASAPGTGNVTLAGATTGMGTFNAEFGTNTIFNYVIDDGAGKWEIGRGYLSASTTLVRETVLESSAGEATLENFGVAVTVFCDAPDEYIERSSRGRNLQAYNANFYC